MKSILRINLTLVFCIVLFSVSKIGCTKENVNPLLLVAKGEDTLTEGDYWLARLIFKEVQKAFPLSDWEEDRKMRKYIAARLAEIGKRESKTS
ncbi:hypothetical protein HOM50_01785 [bacterium]|jgi:hypothetical protein|nr:hypothetical protein [bacterium]MBT5015118.1 hypothetical protein [bacterium]